MKPLRSCHKQSVSSLSRQEKLLLRFRQVVKVCGLFQVLSIRSHQNLITRDVKQCLPILLNALMQEVHKAVGNDTQCRLILSGTFHHVTEIYQGLRY